MQNIILTACDFALCKFANFLRTVTALWMCSGCFPNPEINKSWFMKTSVLYCTYYNFCAACKWVRVVFFIQGEIYLNNPNNCREILPMWEINCSNFRRPKRPECEREAELHGSGNERIKLQVRWCIYSWSGDKRACAWWTCLVMGINRSCSAPATCSAVWNTLPSKTC